MRCVSNSLRRTYQTAHKTPTKRLRAPCDRCSSSKIAGLIVAHFPHVRPPMNTGNAKPAPNNRPRQKPRDRETLISNALRAIRRFGSNSHVVVWCCNTRESEVKVSQRRVVSQSELFNFDDDDNDQDHENGNDAAVEWHARSPFSLMHTKTISHSTFTALSRRAF